MQAHSPSTVPDRWRVLRCCKRITGYRGAAVIHDGRLMAIEFELEAEASLFRTGWRRHGVRVEFDPSDPTGRSVLVPIR